MFVCAMSLLAACSDTKPLSALSSSTAPDSRSVVSTPLSASSATPSCGPAPTIAWPRSGALTAATVDERATVAQSVVTEEVPVDVATVGTISPASSDPACGLVAQVQAAGLQGQVSFQLDADGNYLIDGFHIGPDYGGSLSVRGRHVTFVVDGECSECVSYSAAVRYGSATVTPPDQPQKVFEFDLPVDPVEWGMYCSSARRADGSVAVAGCAPVHPGDFAAS